MSHFTNLPGDLLTHITRATLDDDDCAQFRTTITFNFQLTPSRLVVRSVNPVQVTDDDTSLPQGAVYAKRSATMLKALQAYIHCVVGVCDTNATENAWQKVAEWHCTSYVGSSFNHLSFNYSAEWTLPQWPRTTQAEELAFAHRVVDTLLRVSAEASLGDPALRVSLGDVRQNHYGLVTVELLLKRCFEWPNYTMVSHLFRDAARRERARIVASRPPQRNFKFARLPALFETEGTTTGIAASIEAVVDRLE